MKNTKSGLGFTLIELLVVITIIGILATGAVSVYTSQIQKARDSTRLSDVSALKSGIEQFYQDKDQYPNSSNNDSNGLAFSGVTIYTPKLPSDPKSGQARTGAAFDYIYTVGPDDNTIPAQDYEVSATFENQGNIEKKAEGDGGDDDTRVEIGIDLTGNVTQVTGAISANAASLQCVAVGGGAGATCSANTGTRLLIRQQ